VITSNGYNLIGFTSPSFTATTGDQTNTTSTPSNPQFTPDTLQGNGGPTLTLLPSSSLVLNQGSASLAVSTDGVTPLTTDQRGDARTAAGHVDIGSVEASASDQPAPTVTLTSPANDSLTNNTEPTFSGTANGDLSTVTINIYSGSAAVGTPVQTVMTAASGGTYSVSLPVADALTSGEYTAQASQLDSDGETGYSATSTFTVDTIPPAVTITSQVGTAASPIDPGLGSLANNGGLTDTLLPAGNSPALGTGSIALIPTSVTMDQRGDPRTASDDTVVDIGSVEVTQSATPTAPTVTASTASLPANATTLTIAGTGFDPTAANDTVTFNDGAVGTVTAATTTSLTVSLSTDPTTAESLTAIVTADGQPSASEQVATVIPVVSPMQVQCLDEHLLKRLVVAIVLE
jgi:hypothetical protein